MSACEDLPQELIAAIADDIQDDVPTLKVFSLVCRAWTGPTRDHLFATLTIDKNNIARLNDVDFASTYTPVLRHLHLKFFYDQDQRWREVVPLLANFETPRLRSLTLSGPIVWSSLPPNEQSAFDNRFRSIVCLQLNVDFWDRLTDFANIICSLPHLEKLVLRSSESKLHGRQPVSPLLRLPERLSTLDFFYCDGNCRYFLEWLCSIPKQLSIHTLNLTMDCLPSEDHDNANKFLKFLGPSLEVLRCSGYDLDDYDGDGSPFIDLTFNTNLRCICFYFEFFSDVRCTTCTLSRVGSRLEEVIFNLDLTWGENGFPSAEWIEVDTILASPQFVTVKDVRICALPGRYPGVNLPSLFATLLPTCHARGVISFFDTLLWEPSQQWPLPRKCGTL